MHFKGATTLDNGITFGVQIELEAFQSGDQIDENYAFVSRGFGRIVIGGENTAGYMLAVYAPFVGIPINSGWVTAFVPPVPGHVGTSGFRTPVLNTYLDIGNDNHGVTYYSPRFSGFQIAASWVPSPGTAANGTGDGRNSPAIGDRDAELTDVLSVGVNFTEDFGGFAVVLTGGYTRAGGPDNPVAAGLTAAEDESVQQYMAGANFGFAGFTVGASFGLEDSERLVGGQSVDGWSLDAGAKYVLGKWTVGGTYFHSEVEGLKSNDSEDELDAAQGGVAYDIGPGISARASLLYAS